MKGLSEFLRKAGTFISDRYSKRHRTFSSDFGFLIVRVKAYHQMQANGAWGIRVSVSGAARIKDPG
jgi:hypothetical protein